MLDSNPGFWVKYGLIIFSIMVALVLLISGYIKYPDIIEAPILISSSSPPVKVSPSVSGKIIDLLINDGDSVMQNQKLMIIESDVSVKDAEKCAHFLGELQKIKQPVLISTLVHPEILQLGSIQPIWTSLLNDITALRFKLEEDIIFQQIKSIDNEIVETRILIESLQKQLSIMLDDLNLAEKKLTRQQKLVTQNLLDIQEMESTESAYLQKKQAIENFSSGIGNQKIRIYQLETRQNELSHDRTRELKNYWERITEKSQNLGSALARWELEYTIKAPINGKINYIIPLTKYQFVQKDIALCAILTGDVGVEQKNIGYVRLPIANAGKVKIRQTAIIWLDAYPFQEYGSIEGQVIAISEIPSESNYLLQISLKKELRTSTDFILPVNQELSGKVKIITKEYNIFQRIFQKFEKIKRH